MKVVAFNGSPRKSWNTATVLRHALEGAASKGAETELIHLYDYNYKGCISCFACKVKGGKSYGRCAVNDELRPLLDKVEEAGAILLGSPIYLGSVTGAMRSFIERLVFQYLLYDANYSKICKRKIPTGLIYTMNVKQNYLGQLGYAQNFKSMETTMQRTFGAAESIFVTDTYQFDDYSKYETSAFNEEEKAKRRKEVFPEDCRKAFEMGAGLAEQSGVWL